MLLLLHIFIPKKTTAALRLLCPNFGIPAKSPISHVCLLCQVVVFKYLTLIQNKIMSNLKCLPTCANLTCCNSFWITSLSSHKTFAAQLLTKTFAKQPGCKFYKLFPAQLFCINSSQNRFQIFTNIFSPWPRGVTYYLHQFMPKKIFTNSQT